MLTKQIEGAQKKVEEQNFLIRKRVLEYDDVMNQQREVVYEYRDRILGGEDISATARVQIADAVERLCDQYLAGEFVEEWDLGGLFTQLEQIYPVAMTTEDVDTGSVERPRLIEELRQDVLQAYDERESELGAEIMRFVEGKILLEIIDERWREHLHDMDYLREGIHLRGFAQIDPLVAYKNEGFEMFSALMNSIWEEFARFVFHVDVKVRDENGAGESALPGWAAGASSSSSSSAGSSFSYTGGTAADQPSALAAARQQGAPLGDDEFAEGALETAEAVPAVATRRVDESERIGRNDPCWCGSGKKFKKCHGA